MSRFGSLPARAVAFVFLVFVGIASALQLRQITDPDVWWHLRLGEEFRAGAALSDAPALTPFATSPWVPTQWSLEIVGSYVYEWTGATGLVWLVSAAVTVLAIVLWWTSRRQASAVASAIATIAALVGVAPVLSPRPQVASLVLLAVTAHAWWSSTSDLRPRWWLVPLTWLWACTHGFWFVGVALGAAVGLGIWADHRLPLRRGMALMAVPALAAAAAALTPVGPRLLLAPIEVNAVRRYVMEWQPADFSDPLVLLVALMALFVIVRLARSDMVGWAQVAFLVASLALLVYAARTVALTAVLLAPMLARGLDAALLIERSPVLRVEKRIVAVGAAISLGALVLVAEQRSPYEPDVSDSVEQVLRALGDETVVLNDYAKGGWLAWAHPRLIHAVDGLTESFTADYLDSYFNAYQLRPDWELFVDEVLEADVAWLERGSPLADQLIGDQKWIVVEESSADVVLTRAP